MISAVFAILFGVSLLPGRKPLCLRFAERISDGIMPDGAEAYCRRLTWVWFFVLLANAAASVAVVALLGGRGATALPCGIAACALSAVVVGGTFAVEGFIRARRFSVSFHTSGSTAKPKTIVKTFASLAKEVAFHRARLADVLARKPVFLCTIEPHHMYGQLWRVLLPQAAGCVVDPEVIRTPESLLEKMRAAESVFLVTTPSFLARFTEYADQYDVPQNVVELTTSGALLTADVAAAARRVFGRAPLEIFGSTETGGVASRRQESGDELWTVFEPVKAWSDASGCLVVASPFSCARRFTLGDGVVFETDRRFNNAAALGEAASRRFNNAAALGEAASRRFKLCGRMDRMVKIAEQRVSLPEMEATMCLIPEVAEAALGVVEGPHGPTLGAVIVPKKGWTDLKTLGKRACARALRVKCQQFFPKGAVPRKYRFVHALPRNTQGKVQASAIQEILASQMAEPFVENEMRTSTTYEADLTFDRDAAYFDGHFPEFAVLPGVIQLGTAHRLAETFIGRARTLRQVKKMKFSHVLCPGETVHFTLTKVSEDEFAYDYRKGGVPCASGVLCF